MRGPPASRNHSLGALYAALAALGFAGKAIFIRLAYSKSSVDAVTLLALRMIFSAPLFAWMSWAARPGAPGVRLTPHEWLRLAGLAFLGYYFSTFLDFWGLQFISAALERVLLFTYPTWVLVIMVVVQGRKATLRDVAALALALGGIAISFWSDLRFAGTPKDLWKGSSLVLIASVTYSVYLILGRNMVVRLGSLRFTGDVALMASVGVLAQFFVSRPLRMIQQPPEILWLVLWLALCSTALPIYLLVEALRRVGPRTVSMVSSVGPILTIFLGAAFLGEPLHVLQFVGAAFVLAGVGLASVGPST